MAREFLNSVEQLKESNWEITVDELHNFIQSYQLPLKLMSREMEIQSRYQTQLDEQRKKIVKDEARIRLMNNWLSSVSSKYHPKLVEKLDQFQREIRRLNSVNAGLVAHLSGLKSHPEGESWEDEEDSNLDQPNHELEIPLTRTQGYSSKLSIQERLQRREKNKRWRKKKRIRANRKLVDPKEYRKSFRNGGPKK